MVAKILNLDVESVFSNFPFAFQLTFSEFILFPTFHIYSNLKHKSRFDRIERIKSFFYAFPHRYNLRDSIAKYVFSRRQYSI